jgi:hypothetical protein
MVDFFPAAEIGVKSRLARLNVRMSASLFPYSTELTVK